MSVPPPYAQSATVSSTSTMFLITTSSLVAPVDGTTAGRSGVAHVRGR